MRKIELHWQIFAALIIAVLFGIYLTEYVFLISWMGKVFLRALNMIVIPLLLSSIISGVANIGGGDNLGRLGLKTFSYYMSTSLLAILVGLLLVNLLKPGVGADLGFVKEVEGLKSSGESLGETLINIIPSNLFKAFIEGKMLSIIFFSLLFGFFITKADEKYRNNLTDFFNSTFEVMMKLTMFIIKFTPLGILGLVSGIVAEQAGDIEALISIFSRLGIYSIAVLLGLIIHGSVTLPILLRLIGKVNPLKHFRAMRIPLLTAFSTSSSGATLPLTMEAVEYNSGVSNKITSFTLPLGATINMDGTALYECVAAIFIAQAYGIDLTVTQQIIIIFTSLLASIGAASVPMAGLVMMTIILTAIGLPLEGIGLILAVDRILDMSRTVINVWSDSCGAVIIAKSEGEILNV